MGTVKRKKKATKKKAAKKKAVKRKPVKAEVSDWFDIVEETIREIGAVKGGEVTQDLLRIALRLTVVEKKAKTLMKAMKAALKLHKESKGTFEHGQIAISFPVTHKRSPQWKSEAITLAEKIAELEGEAFDAASFTDSIIETYDLKPSEGVDLTESA